MSHLAVAWERPLTGAVGVLPCAALSSSTRRAAGGLGMVCVR